MQKLHGRLHGSQIRLVLLRPGAAKDPIHCTLLLADLDDDDLAYTALSWTWGPRSEWDKAIFVNGHHQIVPRNLHDGLRAFRSTKTARTFWIDAISINQKDDVEKSIQIPLMTSIYSRAYEVLVWLGDEENDSLYFMDRVRQGLPASSVTIRFERATDWIRMRPWFHRTWTLQEFALSKKSPRVACGKGPSVSWEQLHHGLENGSPNAHFELYKKFCEAQEPGSVAVIMATVKLISKMMQDIFTRGLLSPREQGFMYQLVPEMSYDRSRMRYQFDGHILIGLAIRASDHLTCSDPRDKLYGILGLLSIDDQQYFRDHFHTDYSKPHEAVFHDAILFTFNRDPGQAINLIICYPSVAQTLPGSPSWVPNLLTPHRSGPICLTSKLDEFTYRFTDNSKILVINAYVLADVIEVINFPTLEDIKMKTEQSSRPRLLGEFGPPSSSRCALD